MIPRYTRKEMGEIWSDDNRLRNWVRVEVEAMRARHFLGLNPIEVPDGLEDTIKIDAAAIEHLETKEGGTGHDVMAFLEYTSPQLPEELRPYWHLEMTSMDPGDTSLMLQLTASLRLIQQDIRLLMETIKKRALEHKYTPMIGRTHIVHAEPITFGVKLANWYDELARHRERIDQLQARTCIGKLSGAVGMYTMPPTVEEAVCEGLGLVPVVSTQVISRDHMVEYMTALANLCGSIRKFAVAGRLMQQTEVGELQEAFKKGQKGSSAMPHKRNPIGSENVSGLVTVVQSLVNAAFETQPTWQERDISNSGVERIILPDASILTDYILARFTKIVAGWSVFPDRMRANLNMTKGLIFSQDVQAMVAEKSGLPRKDAYALVYEVAQGCWESGYGFRDALSGNQQIMSRITVEDLDRCFDLKEKLKHTDYIFEKVFGAVPGE